MTGDLTVWPIVNWQEHMHNGLQIAKGLRGGSEQFRAWHKTGCEIELPRALDALCETTKATNSRNVVF